MIVPFPSFATFTLVVYTLKAACSNVQSFLLKFIVTAALENDSSSFLQWILVYGGIQLLYIPLAALATYTQAHLSERWNELMKLQNGNFKKLVDAQREG